MLQETIIKKARAFETISENHPDGKVSKSTGEVLTVTYYSDDEFKTRFNSSDLITLGTGKDTLRWVKADLTPDEIAMIKACKGDDVMRKIMSEALALAKRINNAAKNNGVALSEDKKTTVNDFVRVHLVAALDTFMGAKQDDKVNLPF